MSFLNTDNCNAPVKKTRGEYFVFVKWIFKTGFAATYNREIYRKYRFCEVPGCQSNKPYKSSLTILLSAILIHHHPKEDWLFL